MENINFDDYIDLLKEKDNQAFEIIYEATKRGVFSMIISIVKDKSETEDLMQDTYIKMLKNIHTYKKGRNFVAWLLQIAKYTAIDHYRKTHMVSVYDPIEQSYVFDASVEEKIEPSIDYDIEKYVRVLDETEREVFLLRIVSDVKFKDIAESLNKPLGTVLWIYNKALKKVKKEALGGETSED